MAATFGTDEAGIRLTWDEMDAILAMGDAVKSSGIELKGNLGVENDIDSAMQKIRERIIRR
jgi:hypothetical protein